jgi:hypothetical protein
MDKLDHKMNRQTNQPLHPAVVSAMQLATNKMDRYWKITDLSTEKVSHRGNTQGRAGQPHL